ncbi:MAG TPA: transposase [Tepidisphaeraceae bacterium]|nr:transposase [Tepidisphaeraceae bacterium]
MSGIATRGSDAKAFDVPDELWDRVRPLIPAGRAAGRARTGRPRADDRACLAGIAYVPRAGCGWSPARIPPRGSPPRSSPPRGSGLGRARWVAGAAMAWLGNFRRLRACYERTGVTWQALHELAASMICLKKLVRNIQF